MAVNNTKKARKVSHLAWSHTISLCEQQTDI